VKNIFQKGVDVLVGFARFALPHGKQAEQEKVLAAN
jgi:hypothetical protein